MKRLAHASAHTACRRKLWHPSSITIWSIILGVAVLIVVGISSPATFRSRSARPSSAPQAREQEEALPRVEVIEVGRSAPKSELELPGNIQAITEAPILARADGYIKRRMVDIGDRVRPASRWPKLKRPNWTSRCPRPKRTCSRPGGAGTGAGEPTTRAKPTWNWPASRPTAGTTGRQRRVSRARRTISIRPNIRPRLPTRVARKGRRRGPQQRRRRRSQCVAAERSAGLPRGQGALRGWSRCATWMSGALVNAGNTLLYPHRADRHAAHLRQRPAEPTPIRSASGRPAQLTRIESAGTQFHRHRGADGELARSHQPHDAGGSAGAEPGWRAAARHVRAGGFAQPAREPAAADSGRRPDRSRRWHPGRGGARGSSVHLQRIQVGRDYGDKLEIINGLQPGDLVIANPSDTVHEGMKVDPVPPSK